MVTHNRAAETLRSLDRLTGLPENPEIFVVDNASTDGTAERISERYPQVRILARNNNEGAVARNYALRHARQKYIAFSDDDSWWEAGALERAVRVFNRHSRLALIAAKILVGPQKKIDPVCAGMAESRLSSADNCPGLPVLGFVACGAIVRREPFLKAGGFHSRFGTGGEEQLIAMDLASEGWLLIYRDDIVAFHHPSPVRNPHRRTVNVVRNDLWCTMLRRPPGAVFKKIVRYARLSISDAPTRDGLKAAFRGLNWVLPSRRCAPHHVENRLRMLES